MSLYFICWCVGLVAPDMASWPSGHCSLRQRQMWWTVLPQSWGDWIIARSVLNLIYAMKRQPKTVPVIAVRAYVGQVQLQFHSLRSTLQGDDWSVSQPWCFTPMKRTSIYHWIESCVGPTSGLDISVEEIILLSLAGIEDHIIHSIAYQLSYCIIMNSSIKHIAWAWFSVIWTRIVPGPHNGNQLSSP
jgi:hypothetical protein